MRTLIPARETCRMCRELLLTPHAVAMCAIRTGASVRAVARALETTHFEARAVLEDLCSAGYATRCAPHLYVAACPPGCDDRTRAIAELALILQDERGA